MNLFICIPLNEWEEEKTKILNWEDCIVVLGLRWRKILKALGNLFTKEPGYSGLFKKYWKIKWHCKVKLKVQEQNRMKGKKIQDCLQIQYSIKHT